MDKKALNLPILISIVVGSVIGTGIYVLPASLAQYGTISLLSWVYTSIGAVFLALTFANLNRRYPKTGGPYAYCRQAFGKMTGFVIAYTYWFSNLVSIAALTVSAVGYLGYVLPWLNAATPAYSEIYTLLAELGVVWLFTMINLIGIHEAGVVQLVLTIVKILPLIFISLLGFTSIHLSNLTHFTSGHLSHFSAISSGAALTFWAFIGLEFATVPAENTRGPRDVYKATMYGTLISAAIYILSSVVLMGMIPLSELKNSQFPFAQAGTMLFGSSAALAVAICAFLSGIGAVNACVLVQAQIVFAAARDNLFPHSFATLSKHDVPIRAQLLSSCLVSLLLSFTISPSLLNQFNNIALLASLLALTTYLATTFAEMKFEWASKKSAKLAMNKPMIIAILAAAYSIWMIASMDAFIIKIGFLIILCCVPIYFFTVRKYADK